MAIEWVPRDDRIRDHALPMKESWGVRAPCTSYEKRPVVDADGKEVDGLHAAWITFHNPEQRNAYTVDMIKGVVAGLGAASSDRSVVAVVMTGAGSEAFCTGGSVKEFSEYYGSRPHEFGQYVGLHIAMIDAILGCQKPVLCRVNGMRSAGGQDVGMACDLSISSDLAVFGQVGPDRGLAPVSGSSDFLPWFLTAEDAMNRCLFSEVWSAYKMEARHLLTEVVPVLKKDGAFIRNPLVYTDVYVRNGAIVYGEFKPDTVMAAEKELVKACAVDFELLDRAVEERIWRLANMFPGSLQVSVDAIRAKKRFFWDQGKTGNRHWLAANMMGEGFLGTTAFATRRMTGQDTVDFVKYRRLVARGAVMDNAAFAEVLATTEG